MSKKNPEMLFALQGEGTETVILDIFDRIGDEGGFFGKKGVTAKSVRASLKNATKNAKTVRVTINSGGGNVTEGMAIYAELAGIAHADVDVHIVGIAASMASAIAMAGDHVTMAAGSLFMIHNPWGTARGGSSDMRATADLLDKMQGELVAIYAAKTGKSADDIAAMMKAETWLTADEAKAQGFADAVIKPKKTERKAAIEAFAALDLDDFQNLPAGIREAIEELESESGNRASGLQGQTTPPATPRTEPAPVVASQEKTTMTIAAKTILAALCLSADLTDESVAVKRIADLSKIEASTGETGEAAVGAVMAWKTTAAKVPALTDELAQAKAKILELEGKLDVISVKAELDTLLAQGVADCKVTPAIEAEIRESFQAKDITMNGVKKMLAKLPVIEAFKTKPAPKAITGGSDHSGAATGQDGVVKHEGKSYEEISFTALHDLAESNAETFKALRADWERRGCPARAESAAA